MLVSNPTHRLRSCEFYLMYVEYNSLLCIELRCSYVCYDSIVYAFCILYTSLTVFFSNVAENKHELKDIALLLPFILGHVRREWDQTSNTKYIIFTLQVRRKNCSMCYKYQHISGDEVSYERSRQMEPSLCIQRYA